MTKQKQFAEGFKLLLRYQGFLLRPEKNILVPGWVFWALDALLFQSAAQDSLYSRVTSCTSFPNAIVS
jgi:hypothetical protein